MTDIWDYAPQRSVLDRTIRAQVSAVDYENGFIICDYDGQPSGGKYVTVAPLWMSFPEQGGAAWGRFMPQCSDVVKLNFGYDDRPHMVGFDVQAGTDGVADNRVGWPQLNKLYNDAILNPDAKKSVTKSGITYQVGIANYGKFTPLKPGEYDFMSSGGAYIRGTNAGKLFLAGGGVSISLIKNDLLLSSMSQLYTHQADDSILRFGQVRRIDSGTQLDTIVSSDSNGLYKEFAVALKTSKDVNDNLNLAKMCIGNVVGDDGNVVKLDDVELRQLVQTYNTDGEITYDFKVDTAGRAVLSSQSSVTINSDEIKFQGKDASPKAEHPLILSNTYKDKETQMVSDLVKQVKALADAVDSLCKVIGSSPAAIGPVIPYAAALAAAANITSVQATLMKAQIEQVSVKFSQDWPGCQSKIAKTG